MRQVCDLLQRTPESVLPFAHYPEVVTILFIIYGFQVLTHFCTSLTKNG